MGEPIEPTQVWTEQEWFEQAPWGDMPRGPVRDFLKSIHFLRVYNGGPNKLRDLYENSGVKFQGSPTGRMKPNNPPVDFQFSSSPAFDKLRETWGL